MKTQAAYPLKSRNTFSSNAFCQKIFFPDSLSDLISLSEQLTEPFYILGEGSNTLFIDHDTPTIISPNFKGIKIQEFDSEWIVRVGASENWQTLVEFCLNNGIFGLENLALIPGSVGAAPVQNIGAYGVEFSDYCNDIIWFDFESKTNVKLKTSYCKFGYRTSIFKNELANKGLIIEVSLKFSKKWKANLSYQGLDTLPDNCTALSVMSKVISLRQNKLPDPKILPNAGSFFKNPIIKADKLILLLKQHNNIPYYTQDNGDVKVAAGWLIEQSGLKGYKKGDAGVHDNQALVLVNYGSATGSEILSLAKYVQKCVNDKFGILLSPEVRLVGSEGEIESINQDENYV